MPALALQHGQKVPAAARGNAFRFCARPSGPREGLRPAQDATRSYPMMDILMLALGFGFFALAIGYTYACERL